MRLMMACILSCVSVAALAAPATIEQTLRLDWLDTNASAEDNFDAYANGTWKKTHPIPPEYSSWGSFSVLQEENQLIIHNMLTKIAADKQVKPGSIEQKVGDFYFSGMDEDSINKLGITPLKSEFDNIESIHNATTLQAVIAHLHRLGVGAIFGFGSMQDFKDSTQMIAAIGQGGLSLPDRDYYLKQEKKFKDIRAEFIKHMTNMFMLLGDDSAVALREANTVMQIEMILARASMSQIAQRDPRAIYHIMTLAQLEQLTPSFPWPAYFKAMGQPTLSAVNMGMPEFMKAVNQALVTVSIADWKTYLRWHLLDNSASYLSKPFVDQNFHMSSILTGAETLPPRWKQVVGTENGILGFAVGQLFVKNYFSASAKREVLDMIQNIRNVLRNDLQNLSWMTPVTREAAVKKLDLMENRVGYPDKWRDYSSLNIDRGPYILNILRGSEFLVNYDLNKIGKPVDRTEWSMTPQVVNAYYDPSMNNINIPMGILRPPYFDPNAPASVNYGAIGAIIGHEITHGFDDQGAQFDGKGNLHNWWTPEDLKKFQMATQCIVDQYSQYKVNGDVSVQGKLVVGEATADLGGLILAYRAYHASDEYKQARTIAGYTPDQQFFINFAHVWANNIRPQQAHNNIMVDPHPPAQYRVNGTLANMLPFQSAFDVPDQSVMVNKNKCVIW
ncbi:MAG: M13 family metallopeptidase [Legionellaceae bacterium]|nr:M13 family metallopeptidase [Legionellaceae bacterium]